MPLEKNSFHSLMRFTGRLSTISGVIESKKAQRSQARSKLTQANSCTSGTEYRAWFSLVVSNQASMEHMMKSHSLSASGSGYAQCLRNKERNRMISMFKPRTSGLASDRLQLKRKISSCCFLQLVIIFNMPCNSCLSSILLVCRQELKWQDVQRLH